MSYFDTTLKKTVLLTAITSLMFLYNNCSEFKPMESVGSNSFSSSASSSDPIDSSNPIDVEISEVVAFYNMNLVNGKIENAASQANHLVNYGLTTQQGEHGPEAILDGSSYAINNNIISGSEKLTGISLTFISQTTKNNAGWYNLMTMGQEVNDQALWVSRNGADLRVGIQGSTYISISNYFSNDNLNRYHHFSITYDGENLNLYIDGLIAGTMKGQLDLVKTQLSIGRPLSPKNEFWSGSLGKLRIFKTELTPTEVVQIYKTDFNQREPSSEPVDGGYSAFGAWSTCPTMNCGGSMQTRTRLCNSPAPANGGKQCEGVSSETRACPILNCNVNTPINGDVSDWVNQGTCSKECGSGLQTQVRTCTNPAPANGGLDCTKPLTQTIACNTQACPIINPNPDPLPPPPAVDFGQGGTVQLDHRAKQIGHDAVKDLQARNSSTHKAIKSGNWSAATTWQNGQIPGNNSNVFIPSEYAITYDVVSDARIKYIRIDGALNFATNKDTKLIVDTLISNPGSDFTIGTKDQPIATNVKAEILIANNGPVTYNNDPQQLSRGLILQGHVKIHGMKKAAHLPLDLPANNGRKFLNAGSTQIKLKGDMSNWNVGDEIVIMGTKRGSYQDEKRTIKAINGNTVTLNSGLQYIHDTPSFQTNNISGISELDIHVGNLTRNVLIHSEYKSYNDVKRRGHVMIMHVDGADIRYAAFLDLGRTDKRIEINDAYHPGIKNPEGRYPLYFHHTGVDPGRVPFKAIGNAVSRSPGWGIVQQDSYGAINHNFVYDIIGAGIVSEDGNEIGDWIGNFVTNLKGASGRTKVDHTIVQVKGYIGYAGIAFECQSRMINIKHNIAANARIGWSFLGVRGSRGHLKDKDSPGITDNSPDQPYFKNPLIVTTRDPNPMTAQFNERPGSMLAPMVPNFTNVNYNQSIALDTGINSWHRLRPWNMEFLNNIRHHVSWRTSKAFNFINYIGGYHVSKSLFVENGSIIKAQEKTSKNSIVQCHIENSSDTFRTAILSLNFEGVFYNNTEKNVKNPVNGQKFPNIEGGRKLANVNSSSLVHFKLPYAIVTNGLKNKIPHPVLNLTNKPVVGPRKGVVIEGTVTDSLNTRIYNAFTWMGDLGKLGNDLIYNTSDDKDHIREIGIQKGFKGPAPGRQDLIPPSNGFGAYFRNTYKWTQYLEIYGAYKKNGKWIMPIPIWLNDTYDGLPYPFLVDYEIQGANEADLIKYQLTEYPKIDLTNVSFGNPNVNANGSFKNKRTYFRENWRVPID